MHGLEVRRLMSTFPCNCFCNKEDDNMIFENNYTTNLQTHVELIPKKKLHYKFILYPMHNKTINLPK
jgi:hypothetical protein